MNTVSEYISMLSGNDTEVLLSGSFEVYLQVIYNTDKEYGGVTSYSESADRLEKEGIESRRCWAEISLK